MDILVVGFCFMLDCQYDGSQNPELAQQFLIMEDNPLQKKPNK
jgi:hypothetical protein